jgi:poly(A) polymerase
LIGSPEDRINEDKLRMMRVIRFAVKYDLIIESRTYNSIKRNSDKILQVSKERISDEFLKMLRLHKPRAVLNLLSDLCLLDFFLPEVKRLQGVEQPKEFHKGDVFEHTILALEQLPTDSSDELLMATLLHDIGKPNTQTFDDRIRFNGHDEISARLTEELLIRLKFPNEFIQHTTAMVANHMRFSCVKQMKKSTLKRFFQLEKFEEHLILHKADCLGSNGLLDNFDFVTEKIKEFSDLKEEIKPQRLFTGEDLIQLGFKPSPEFKEILLFIETLQLEGEVKTKEEALRIVQEKFKT